MDTDIFMLFFQSMDANCGSRVHFAHHNRQALAGTAGAGQVAQHRLAPPDIDAGLFLRFTAAHVFNALAGFDHTRHHFQ
ncbi:hypothetical protein D3C81_1855410 [compost metagenome]